MNEALEFIDSSFAQDNLARYHLSIQISKELLRVCVNDVKTSSPVAIWQRQQLGMEWSNGDELQALLASCSFPVNNNYRSVSLAIINSSYTYLPSALFLEENVEDYITMNCGNIQDAAYAYNLHSNLGVVLAFALPLSLQSYFKLHYPNAKIWHHGSLLLNSVYRDFKPMDKEQLFVQYNHQRLELLFFSEGEFKFGNSFLVETPEDFIYYILFVCEQLSVNTQTLKLILLGEIKLGSDFHQLLYNYFQKIQFGQVQSNIKVAMGLNELPKHFYYTLFNQFLCE